MKSIALREVSGNPIVNIRTRYVSAPSALTQFNSHCIRIELHFSLHQVQRIPDQAVHPTRPQDGFGGDTMPQSLYLGNSRMPDSIVQKINNNKCNEKIKKSKKNAEELQNYIKF